MYKYVYNQWIKKAKIFNYYNFIKESSDKFNILLEYIYLTNNIAENIHPIISKKLLKNTVSFKDIIFSMKNLIIYNETKEQNTERNDYISKALINISLNIKENNLS